MKKLISVFSSISIFLSAQNVSAWPDDLYTAPQQQAGGTTNFGQSNSGNSGFYAALSNPNSTEFQQVRTAIVGNLLPGNPVTVFQAGADAGTGGGINFYGGGGFLQGQARDAVMTHLNGGGTNPPGNEQQVEGIRAVLNNNGQVNVVFSASKNDDGSVRLQVQSISVANNPTNRETLFKVAGAPEAAVQPGAEPASVEQTRIPNDPGGGLIPQNIMEQAIVGNRATGTGVASGISLLYQNGQEAGKSNRTFVLGDFAAMKGPAVAALRLFVADRPPTDVKAAAIRTALETPGGGGTVVFNRTSEGNLVVESVSLRQPAANTAVEPPAAVGAVVAKEAGVGVPARADAPLPRVVAGGPTQAASTVLWNASGGLTRTIQSLNWTVATPGTTITGDSVRSTLTAIRDRMTGPAEAGGAPAGPARTELVASLNTLIGQVAGAGENRANLGALLTQAAGSMSRFSAAVNIQGAEVNISIATQRFGSGNAASVGNARAEQSAPIRLAQAATHLERALVGSSVNPAVVAGFTARLNGIQTALYGADGAGMRRNITVAEARTIFADITALTRDMRRDLRR